MKWEIRCTTICTYICHVEAPSKDAVDKFYEWTDSYGGTFVRMGEEDWELSEMYCIDNDPCPPDLRHVIHINEEGEVAEGLPDE